jgi:general stress protein YciG
MTQEREREFDAERDESLNEESSELGSEEMSEGGDGKSGRGFASMSEEERRRIASKGGRSQGKESNPGNFANDPERAREAGRRGGQA